jgi:hypothetical protein
MNKKISGNALQHKNGYYPQRDRKAHTVIKKFRAALRFGKTFAANISGDRFIFQTGEAG